MVGIYVLYSRSFMVIPRILLRTSRHSDRGACSFMVIAELKYCKSTIFFHC